MRDICFLQYELCGGGAERKVCTLANYFVSKGCRVEICLFGRNVIEYELDDRVKVTFINRDHYIARGDYHDFLYKIDYVLASAVAFIGKALEELLRMLRLLNREICIKDKIWNRFSRFNNYTAPFRRFVKNHKNDVFITMMINTFLGVVDVLGDKYVIGKNKLSYIVMDCNNPKMNADQIMNEKRNFYFSKISRAVVMTEGAKFYYPPSVQRNMDVIPNPVRPDLPEIYHGVRKKVIVTFCRLTAQKNLPCLIDAFELFHEEFPEYQLWIYGKGELRDVLLKKIQNDCMEKYVFIYDFKANVHQEIRDASMFVSSSLWEGFPNSILEALSIGLPVISTDCDYGPRDMIIDHKNGILVPLVSEGNATLIYKAMSELASNSELCEHLSHEAVKVRSVFDVDIIGSKWLQLINSI